MKFSEKTKKEARLRQSGLCGMCAESLDNLWEEAHHIYPHGQGGLNRADNCVILCDNCHYVAHNYGNYRIPIVLGKRAYKYFNGKR